MPSVCVVMASGGYPGSYAKGKPIRGLDEAARLPNTKVFHAGTARAGDQIVTAAAGCWASRPGRRTCAARAMPPMRPWRPSASRAPNSAATSPPRRCGDYSAGRCGRPEALPGVSTGKQQLQPRKTRTTRNEVPSGMQNPGQTRGMAYRFRLFCILHSAFAPGWLCWRFVGALGSH